MSNTNSVKYNLDDKQEFESYPHGSISDFSFQIQDEFKSKKGKYSYLPTKFESSHCPYLELLPNHDLLCAWFSGKREGYNRVSIVISYLGLELGNNQKWTKPMVIAQTEGYSNQNPVLFYHPRENKLYLFYTSQKAADNFYTKGNTTKLYYKTCDLSSQKSKYTQWSQPSPILPSKYLMAKGRPIYFEKDNYILLPIYDKDNNFRNRDIKKSDKSGATSHHISVILKVKFGGEPIFEYHLLPETKGKVQGHLIKFDHSRQIRMFLRDRSKENIYYITSLDNGMTWDNLQKTNLPSNNSGICALKVYNRNKEEIILMLYNNTTKGRSPLSIAYSTNRGVTFKHLFDLEKVRLCYDKAIQISEYSYPNALVDKNNQLHIVYTYSRFGIKYVVLSLDDLLV